MIAAKGTGRVLIMTYEDGVFQKSEASGMVPGASGPGDAADGQTV